jgi:hypothetical protein
MRMPCGQRDNSAPHLLHGLGHVGGHIATALDGFESLINLGDGIERMA